MDVKLFKKALLEETYRILINNVPYREPYTVVTKRGYTVVKNDGAVGKKGTAFYSPYPKNLKNNGVYRTNDAIVLDVKKVGYIPYANKTAHWHTNGGTNGGPEFVKRTEEDVVAYLRSIGCKVVKQ